MFEFHAPVANKKIVWKPLDVGQQLMTASSYQGSQEIYRTAAMMAKRIVQYGDQPPALGMEACSFGMIQTWDEIDYGLFVDDVERRESERYSTFKKKEPPTTAMLKAQDSVSKAVEAHLTAIKALGEAMGALKEAQLATSATPLNAR